MGFDASKLIVGKKYPTRDGGKVEFVRAWLWSTIGEAQLIWLSCLGDKYGQCYTSDASGRQMTVTKAEGGMDIISDEPIKEPVKVTNHMRFLNVYPSGCVGGHRTRCDADSEASHDRIGVYELPAEIEVTTTK